MVVILVFSYQCQNMLRLLAKGNSGTSTFYLFVYLNLCLLIPYKKSTQSKLLYTQKNGELIS